MPRKSRAVAPSRKATDPWNQVQWQSWAQLFKRAQGGDSEAYRQFLEEIGPILFSYVRRRVFNPEMVPDVYQEVLLTLHKARHAYEPSRPLGPWLFTVARNSILDALGKNRKFAEKEVQLEVLPDVGEMERDGSLDDQLYQGLQSLPELNRKAVELLKLKGLTLEEAAAQLGISVAALKVRAHRGYHQLRKLLKGKGT
ncbi:MAG TPA: RNA polymerase sigma factor [bacterium]|nr:RNA polymerase sigma factor [bacterium]